jgi:hypothetical protein
MKGKLGFVVLGGALLSLAGCGSPMEPTQFNSAVVMGNKKLAKAAGEFRSVFHPLEKGQAPGISDVTRAREKLGRALEDAKRDFDNITPTDSSAGQDLYDAYKKFLQVEEQLFREEFGTGITNALQQGGNNQNKWAAVQQVFARIQSREQAELDKVKEKQKAFAKGHNIQLSGTGGMPGMPGMPGVPGGGPPGGMQPPGGPR